MIKSVSHEFFMTISIKRDLKITHMNIYIVFLYEFVDEIIYVIQSILFKIEKNANNLFVKKSILRFETNIASLISNYSEFCSKAKT